jgi:hypothetical protein
MDSDLMKIRISMNTFVKNLIVPAATGLVAALGLFSMTGCHGDGERVTVIEHAQPAPPPPTRTVIVAQPPREERVIVAPPPPREHRVIVAPARPCPPPPPAHRERIVIHDGSKPGKGGPAHHDDGWKNGRHGDNRPDAHNHGGNPKGDKPKGSRPGKGHPDDKDHGPDHGQKPGR